MATLSANNQFHFNCPTLGVEAKLADCITLRDRVSRGEKPDERRGCQACMASSKCAAQTIVHNMWVFKRDPGYFSATYKLGQLDQDVIARLGPVIVQEKTLDQLGVTDAERNAILAANAQAGKSTRSGVDTTDWAQPKKRSAKPKGEKSVEKVPESSTVAAALTGDMSAALNKIAATPAAAPKPDPKPEPKPAPAPAPQAGLSLLERARLAKQGRAA